MATPTLNPTTKTLHSHALAAARLISSSFPISLPALSCERNYWAHILSAPFTDIQFLSTSFPCVSPAQLELLTVLKRSILHDLVHELGMAGAQGVFPPEKASLVRVRNLLREWDSVDGNIVRLMFLVSSAALQGVGVDIPTDMDSRQKKQWVEDDGVGEFGRTPEVEKAAKDIFGRFRQQAETRVGNLLRRAGKDRASCQSVVTLTERMIEDTPPTSPYQSVFPPVEEVGLEDLHIPDAIYVHTGVTAVKLRHSRSFRNILPPIEEGVEEEAGGARSGDMTETDSNVGSSDSGSRNTGGKGTNISLDINIPARMRGEGMQESGMLGKPSGPTETNVITEGFVEAKHTYLQAKSSPDFSLLSGSHREYSVIDLTTAAAFPGQNSSSLKAAFLEDDDEYSDNWWRFR